MSDSNGGWIWDAGWKQYRRYLPDEGNWQYANGYVVDPSGKVVRMVGTTALQPRK
jgi:hypothetical protein